VALEMPLVDLGADPADRPVAAPGDPAPHVDRAQERVALLVQMVEPLERQGLHPARIIRVQGARELD
jgi:hypothetical protein